MTDRNDSFSHKILERIEAEESGSTRLFRFEVPERHDRLKLTFHTSTPSDQARAAMVPAIDQALDRYYLEGEPDHLFASIEEHDKQEIVQEYAGSLQHLISLTLYGPDGDFFGRRDARSPFVSEPIVIDCRCPSPGFLPKDIAAGAYTVALEIHQVLSGGVDFDVEITAGDIGPADLKSDTAASEQASDACSQSVTSQPGRLKAALFVPTIHGEGSLNLETLCAQAALHGLDVLFIADVNSAAVWKSLSGDLPCRLFIGQVFDTYRGRSAALNLQQPILVNDNAEPTPTQWIAARVHEQAGLFAVLHPYALGEPIQPGFRWTHDDLELENVDLLHVWSGPWATHSAEIRNSLHLWDYLLCNGLCTRGVAADCALMRSEEWNGNLPYLDIRCHGRSQEEIFNSIAEGRFIASIGPGLEIGIVTGSVLARTGEEVTLDEGTPYRVVVEAAGYTGSVMLRLIQDGKLLVEMPLSSKGEDRKAFHALASRPRTYFRAELHRFGYPGDELLALSNPVYQISQPIWRRRPPDRRDDSPSS